MFGAVKEKGIKRFFICNVVTVDYEADCKLTSRAQTLA